MAIQLLPDNVEDMILDALSPASLFKYGRTNKSNNAVVQRYTERRFRISKLLERYFSPSEIYCFRQLQAITGAVISGSTALQFFLRVVYPESDLDIYVSYIHCEELGVWLLNTGYQYAPRAEKSNATFLEDAAECFENMAGFSEEEACEPGPDDGIYFPQLVFNFGKTNPDRKIQLIMSVHSPFDSILNFHSTCTMNFITHATAYSLFPLGTFEDSVALSLPNKEASAQRAVEKYRLRGWNIFGTVPLDEDLDNAIFPFKQGMRHVGDAHCWSMPVLPKVVSTSAHSYSVIESNSWLVEYNKQRALSLVYKTVKSPRLQFNYVIPGHGGDDTLVDLVETRLWGKMEHNHSSAAYGDSTLDNVLAEIMRHYQQNF